MEHGSQILYQFPEVHTLICCEEKQNLAVTILADPELKVIQAYDVWKEKKNYGKVSFGTVRSTFVIDENGIIEKVMPKVKPDTNAAEILEYLRG